MHVSCSAGVPRSLSPAAATRRALPQPTRAPDMFVTAQTAAVLSPCCAPGRLTSACQRQQWHGCCGQQCPLQIASPEVARQPTPGRRRQHGRLACNPGKRRNSARALKDLTPAPNRAHSQLISSRCPRHRPGSHNAQSDAGLLPRRRTPPEWPVSVTPHRGAVLSFEDQGKIRRRA